MYNIIEFFKSNWAIWVQMIIAILAILAMYHIYRKGQYREKEKEERDLKEDIKDRLSKVEAKIDLLANLYPQLKSLEKLENFEKLNLTRNDIKKTVSEVLKTTGITPETIDVRIDEKIERKLSNFDRGITTLVAQKLNEIDKRFEKPVASASDYLIIGNAEYHRKDYLAALGYYEKTLEIEPDYVKAWYNKGVVLDELKRFEEALKAYDKATELKPDYYNAWYNKGIVLGKLKRFEEALKAYDKAIELKPADAEAWYNRGVALGKLNRYDESLKAYDKAIELKPDYAKAWYNKACIYSIKRKKEEALSHLRKAIEIDAHYKEKAKEDEDFKNLWDDEDFKKVVS